MENNRIWSKGDERREVVIQIIVIQIVMGMHWNQVQEIIPDRRVIGDVEE